MPRCRERRTQSAYSRPGRRGRKCRCCSRHLQGTSGRLRKEFPATRTCRDAPDQRAEDESVALARAGVAAILGRKGVADLEGLVAYLAGQSEHVTRAPTRRGSQRGGRGRDTERESARRTSEVGSHGAISCAKLCARAEVRRRGCNRGSRAKRAPAVRGLTIRMVSNGEERLVPARNQDIGSSAAMSSRELLAALLAPISVSAFFADYYEKQHLCTSREKSIDRARSSRSASSSPPSPTGPSRLRGYLRFPSISAAVASLRSSAIRIGWRRTSRLGTPSSGTRRAA